MDADHLNPSKYSDSKWTRALKDRDAEIHRLNTVIGILEAAAKRDVALITETADFVSACRFAGIDGLDTLKEEATKLYKRVWDATK